MTTPPTVPTTSIADRIAEVRTRIEAACARAGRNPNVVTLVAVSKTFNLPALEAALAAGLTDFGENRAQELLPKARAALEAGLLARWPRLRWHFIGHLQRNKAREIVPLIHTLHSLDSVRLIEAVAAARRSSDAVHPLPCYLEVNIAGEAQKQGVPPSEVGALLDAASRASGVEVVGLMTVAPLVADPEAARPTFRALRQLASAQGLTGLSMGMTNDYEVAIEEGATIVRVGRAIFGDRAT